MSSVKCPTSCLLCRWWWWLFVMLLSTWWTTLRCVYMCVCLLEVCLYSFLSTSWNDWLQCKMFMLTLVVLSDLLGLRHPRVSVRAWWRGEGQSASPLARERDQFLACVYLHSSFPVPVCLLCAVYPRAGGCTIDTLYTTLVIHDLLYPISWLQFRVHLFDLVSRIIEWCKHSSLLFLLVNTGDHKAAVL